MFLLYENNYYWRKKVVAGDGHLFSIFGGSIKTAMAVSPGTNIQ